MIKLEPSYVDFFAKQLQFPEDACAELNQLAQRIVDDKNAAAEFSEMYKEFFLPEPQNFNEIDNKMASLSALTGAPIESLSFLLLISGTQQLHEKYRTAGIGDDIYWDTMSDFKSKLLECHEVRGKWGTFVTSWFEGFFLMNRFKLGRFEYQVGKLEEDYYLADGRVIPSKHLKLECHIPSAGAPLTDEVRMDSYRRAYFFFRPQMEDDLLCISCRSWLLYPKHLEFLPKDSNILRFMDDFDIVDAEEKEGFKDGWRIFGGKWELPYEQLPENTSLQRAYKKWLMQYGMTGSGYGIIIFDGTKIINKRNND